MALRIGLFVLLTACLLAAQAPTGETPAPAPAATRYVEVYTVSTPDGSVTAHFMGEKFASNLQIPFGVHQLEFTFAGDPERYAFRTDGVIAFPDWNTRIFSPSGDWVVLLKGQHGPFIVVSAKKLKDYLKGSAKPETVLSAADFRNLPNSGNSYDYHFDQWTSYDGFLFSATCCGKELQFDYQIPDKALKLAQTLPASPQ